MSLRHARHAPLKRYLPILLIVLVAGGARPECDARIPGTLCESIDMMINPGETIVLTYPCPGVWGSVMGVSLVDPPPGVWPVIERRPTGTRVFIQTAADVGLFRDRQIGYLITAENGRLNGGTIVLSTLPPVTPITVTTTATPPVVTFGESSQLNAEASGGAPPYTFRWLSSFDELSDTTVANPLATPLSTTGYWLQVTDSEQGGNISRAWVTVLPTISLTATPQTVDPGGLVDLEAELLGSSFTFGVRWDPASALVTPAFSTLARARPDVTTLFTFFYEDGEYTVSDTITVYVR